VYQLARVKTHTILLKPVILLFLKFLVVVININSSIKEEGV